MGWILFGTDRSWVSLTLITRLIIHSFIEHLSTKTFGKSEICLKYFFCLSQGEISAVEGMAARGKYNTFTNLSQV